MKSELDIVLEKLEREVMQELDDGKSFFFANNSKIY